MSENIGSWTLYFRSSLECLSWFINGFYLVFTAACMESWFWVFPSAWSYCSVDWIVYVGDLFPVYQDTGFWALLLHTSTVYCLHRIHGPTCWWFLLWDMFRWNFSLHIWPIPEVLPVKEKRVYTLCKSLAVWDFWGGPTQALRCIFFSHEMAFYMASVLKC